MLGRDRALGNRELAKNWRSAPALVRIPHMKLSTLAAAAFLALSACGKQDAPPPPPAAPGAAAPSAPRPEKIANGEPAVITVKHVLVAFEGAQRSEQKRTRRS